MTSKQLISFLTATTVITVGAAIAYALPQQSYPLYEPPRLPQSQPTYVQPKYVQPKLMPPNYARRTYALPPEARPQTAKIPSPRPGASTYGFHATPKIPALANLQSYESNPSSNGRVVMAGLETGDVANTNSPLAKTVATVVDSAYDVAPDLDAAMLGDTPSEPALLDPAPTLLESALPKSSVADTSIPSSISELAEEFDSDLNSDDSRPDLNSEFAGDLVEEPNYEATDSAPISITNIDPGDNQFTAQQSIESATETVVETIDATPEPVAAESDAGFAQIDVPQVEEKLSAPVMPQQIFESSSIESNPIQSIDPPSVDIPSFAAQSVIESPNSFSPSTAVTSRFESTAPTFGAFYGIRGNREGDSWQAPLTGNSSVMSNPRPEPIVQSNPFFQSNQWVPPVTGTTPGHNEMVPMNSNLSLSPPAQPGAAVHSYLPVQPPAFAMSEYIPNFNPQVGHRQAMPIQRGKVYPIDDGEKFDFETKKRDFPPFNEIIATGRFFYMAEVLWAEPQFQGNTAIATEAVNFGESIPLDFDSDFHPRIRLGFESQYGPGVELTYFNINSNSEIASFTSDGNVIGHTNAWVIGRNVWSRIVADDPGEILSTQHSIDIDSGVVSFFKELKFPISRVNGNFGFQYVSIAQRLNANVVAADGVTVESLSSVSDMRAYGPRAVLEYYRPIGHTPMELVTTFGGAVLFGQRDQVVTNSQTGLENRLGADEFLTILDFLVAVQYTKTVGENRSVYGRLGFMNQTWIGGGTAAFPQGDFGLRGLTFGIGYNR
jgi:hypothetical protein